MHLDISPAEVYFAVRALRRRFGAAVLRYSC